MAETPYQTLAADDRRDALRVAQDRSPHRAFLLEKDIWVVATLSALFDAPFGKDLAFKGGTSLSKAYRAIRRFSEDVDITYDIRAFAPDLVADAGDEALPPTRSQERRWTRAIRARLDAWVRDEAGPSIKTKLQSDGFQATVSAQAERLRIVYEPLFDDYAFVRPEVTVEFGARSTGEPRVPRSVAYSPRLRQPPRRVRSRSNSRATSSRLREMRPCHGQAESAQAGNNDTSQAGTPGVVSRIPSWDHRGNWSGYSVDGFPGMTE